MKRLVLLRQGESEWNRENRFTGWTDVRLSQKGIEEAMEAGRLLKKEGYVFDVAFTSVLARAVKTLWLGLEPTINSRYFMLSTASLSALGYEGSSAADNPALE